MLCWRLQIWIYWQQQRHTWVKWSLTVRSCVAITINNFRNWGQRQVWGWCIYVKAYSSETTDPETDCGLNSFLSPVKWCWGLLLTPVSTTGNLSQLEVSLAGIPSFNAPDIDWSIPSTTQFYCTLPSVWTHSDFHYNNWLTSLQEGITFLTWFSQTYQIGLLMSMVWTIFQALIT